MISDLAITSNSGGAVVPNETFSAVIQPVRDVSAYLARRTPVMFRREEMPLFLTLPNAPENNFLRDETEMLCTACEMVRDLIADASVQAACKKILGQFPICGWKLGTFRQKIDWWVEQRDWTVLVNRSRAGGGWIERDCGLPDAFLDFCAGRIGEFKRKDAATTALRSILRQWETGVNHRGQEEVIPGYAANWRGRVRDVLPAGWTTGNIHRQLKQRAKLTKATKALLHHGISAARTYIAQVRSTREGLRFLEEVQFDDVKVDFRVFDTATGKPVDLWLLIAHDRATGMLLGFGLRPATVREDGSQTHLKLQDAKQLIGWTLERYGVPPYKMTFKFERGTASPEDSAAALEEMLHGRLNCSFTSMIRGNSPSGYLERALGNSKGKASLESNNRIGHLLAAGLPGQVGPHYGARPMDVAAREKECVLIWKAVEEMPAGLRERLRAEFGYPLLTLPQARRELVRVFNLRNARTDHNMEGFEKIVVRNSQGDEVQRMESPAERMVRLCEGLQFDAVSPEILCAFYEHTQRARRVEEDGHIRFTHEGRLLEFCPPGADYALRVGTKVLGYFHPDNPRFLHLTDGRGGILGTWLRRALVRHDDRVAIAEAIALQASALKVAKARAAELNGGETQRLAGMRERNARLMDEASFVDVTTTPVMRTVISDPLANHLNRAKEFIEANPPEVKPIADCTEEILAREEAAPEVKFD